MELYEERDIPLVEFCRQMKLKYSPYGYWLSKYRRGLFTMRWLWRI